MSPRSERIALQQKLEQAFEHPSQIPFAGRIALRCTLPAAQQPDSQGLHLNDESDLGFELSAVGLHWLTEGPVDAIFYFENVALAEALLIGPGDAMRSFSAGTFRASGYLLWTLPLLTLFRTRAGGNIARAPEPDP